MNAEDLGGGIGSASPLRQEREARGWTVAEVAQRLHINEAQVRALEAGRYEALPGAAFARGFLKNYALLLGLDPAPLLASYDASSGGVAVRPTERVLPDSEGPMLDYSWRTIGVSLLALLILVLLVWWIWEGRGGPAEPVRSMAPAASVAGEGLAAVPAQIPAPAMIRSAPAVAVSAATSPAAVVAGTGSSPPLPAAAAADLVFRFSGNCWVQVKDATGKVLLAELGRAGAQAQVSGGIPPYQVLVGNVKGVVITYRGAAVALPAHSQQGVARLRIGVAPAAGAAGTAPARSARLPRTAVPLATPGSGATSSVSSTASASSEVSHAP
ncbi:MAG: helix-turn-helix domain-containing protein [Acidithiobacillus sp.]|uniref:helix-turn-helix domain-containing protein n=1 Tax=Acidithiobacillus sp. TaxID=1872118 RepID=UPI003D078C01